METPFVPERKRQRSLKYSVLDAVFYACMAGFGEAYFIPLLLFLGGTNYQVGVFTASPQFFLAFTYFLGLLITDRLAARKKIIAVSVAIQIAFLAVIFTSVLKGFLSPWLFVVLAMGYFGVNGVIIPAWSSLLGDLTTSEDRGRYFGRRSSLSQLVAFGAVLGAGLILQRFDSTGRLRQGFALILCISLTSRIGSLLAVTRHFDVPYSTCRDDYFSIWQFLRKTPTSNFAHFVFFTTCMNFALQVASPFFTPYMIRDLKFTYIQYMLSQGALMAAQFISMRRWGPFSDKYGNRIVLLITGALLPLNPILWFFSRNFYYIIAIQVFAGLLWGGWALSAANFLFDAVTPPKRARCSAYMNFFNSLGVALGTMTGAWLTARSPRVLDTGAMRISFISPLQFNFLLSSILRFLVAVAFLPAIREVRDVEHGKPKDMFSFMVQLRPFSGMRFFPFISGR